MSQRRNHARDDRRRGQNTTSAAVVAETNLNLQSNQGLAVVERQRLRAYAISQFSHSARKQLAQATESRLNKTAKPTRDQYLRKYKKILKYFANTPEFKDLVRRVDDLNGGIGIGMDYRMWDKHPIKVELGLQCFLESLVKTRLSKAEEKYKATHSEHQFKPSYSTLQGYVSALRCDHRHFESLPS